MRFACLLVFAACIVGVSASGCADQRPVFMLDAEGSPNPQSCKTLRMSSAYACYRRASTSAPFVVPGIGKNSAERLPPNVATIMRGIISIRRTVSEAWADAVNLSSVTEDLFVHGCSGTEPHPFGIFKLVFFHPHLARRPNSLEIQSASRVADSTILQKLSSAVRRDPSKMHNVIAHGFALGRGDERP